jgi:adenylate cyclase
MSEQRIQRRLAAILAADVVGYSRAMERDEASTLSALKARRQDLVAPLIARHQGRIFKELGDATLAEFGSAVNAVECAAELQRAMAAANSDVPEAQRIVLRIGVNLGDVMIEGTDLYGDGVNVAARLEALAEPGGVAISDMVHEHLRGRIAIDFVDRGRHEVKNIARPVHVWAWSPDISASEAIEAANGAPVLPAKPSIAVLPFDNMSGDPEQGYFADGITEDIITDLSKVSGLFVIARNSSFAYKGKSPDVRQVSRELGVRYVLEGSVRRAANRVRINAQMIDGTNGGHLWAERYDRDLSDIFAVQDEVTRTIVGALKIKLTESEEAQREGRRKIAPEAYDLLVRARQTMMQLRPEAAIQTRRMLEHVLTIEPGLSLAYARLSMITFAEYANRWNGATEANLPQAVQLAEKAIALDASDPQAHVSMSIALAWTHRLDEAEKAAERAIELDPNFADGYTALGNMRDFLGRTEEAVPLYTRAWRLDPQFDMTLHFMGRALLALGRYDEAETAFKKRLALSPHSDMTRFYLACLYGKTGRHEEARRYFKETLEANPNFSVAHLKAMLPYRDPTWFDRMTSGLKDAGIEV